MQNNSLKSTLPAVCYSLEDRISTPQKKSTQESACLLAMGMVLEYLSKMEVRPRNKCQRAMNGKRKSVILLKR